MSARVFSLSLVILFVLCACNAAGAATIGQRRSDLAPGSVGHRVKLAPMARQSQDDFSDEDSDEDDEDEDEEVAPVQTQQALNGSYENSDEDDEEDDDADDQQDDDLRRRKRRDTEQAESGVDVPSDNKSEEPAASDTEVTTAAPSKKSSVLILIRDALKKVTTELPTEQVATSALQYFQLFEHFLQQTIENVIGDDDDDDDEATTVKVEAEAEAESPVTKAPEAAAAAVEATAIVHASPVVEETVPVLAEEHVAPAPEPVGESMAEAPASDATASNAV